jgi:hypothetical protein
MADYDMVFCIYIYTISKENNASFVSHRNPNQSPDKSIGILIGTRQINRNPNQNPNNQQYLGRSWHGIYTE